MLALDLGDVCSMCVCVCVCVCVVCVCVCVCVCVYQPQKLDRKCSSVCNISKILSQQKNPHLQ